MDYMVVISAVVLGLSVLATVAKFLDWFMHSDPRTMIRTTRWMLLLLLVACIPLLVMMIINQQWAAAMLIGAGMLVIPTLLEVAHPVRAPARGLRLLPAKTAALRHGDLAGSAGRSRDRAPGGGDPRSLCQQGLPDGAARRAARPARRRGSPKPSACRAARRSRCWASSPAPTRPRSVRRTSACCGWSIPTAAARPISPGESTRPATRCLEQPPQDQDQDR